jgi:hypothetical protein
MICVLFARHYLYFPLALSLTRFKAICIKINKSRLALCLLLPSLDNSEILSMPFVFDFVLLLMQAIADALSLSAHV